MPERFAYDMKLWLPTNIFFTSMIRKTADSIQDVMKEVPQFIAVMPLEDALKFR